MSFGLNVVIRSARSCLRRRPFLPFPYAIKEFSSNNKSYWRSSIRRQCLPIIAAGVLVFGYGFKRRKAYAQVQSSKEREPGEEIPGFLTYPAEEVSKHSSQSARIWVTYKSGVYDITEFVKEHPGGEKILMAAGGQLEPFWDLFAVHKRKDVFEILEKYRIGNLLPEDREAGSPSIDHWVKEPRRHPVLLVRSSQPFNAEPPAELLVENFITPNSIFFIRNHLPVPVVDEKEYRLTVSGIGLAKDVELTLDDLKTKFPITTITATLQCAGNRRSEMNKVKEVRGLNWGKGAMGTARWTGVKLVDVLRIVGAKTDDKSIKHVQFEGLDLDPSSSPYGASIPASRALDPKADILIAFEMNGKPIPRDHGFPVRVVAPGITGARNVKWLGSIILSNAESDSLWQQRDYKGFPPSVDASNVDWSSAPAIQDYPIQSAICYPERDSLVMAKNSDETITIKGYAFSGGGRKITRVDVSIDGGNNWHQSELKHDPDNDSDLYNTWCWTLWESKVSVKGLKSGTKLDLVCKATDSGYSVQPEHFNGIWNFRGVLSNAWNRVAVTLG